MMKSGIMQWVSHSNMPILSVDAQPNGFRFVTGGSDHKVCIWNLLPAISARYELPSNYVDVNSKKTAEEHKSNFSSAQGSRPIINGGDEEMKEVENGSEEEVPGKTETDRAILIEDEEGFESDIQLMESLFDNPKKRFQKQLAVLDSHVSPVNCVRWNNIGTLFASASDDGAIILWEYVGEMTMTAFQKFNLDTSGRNDRMMMPSSSQFAEESKGLEENNQDDTQYEEWRLKRTWSSHRGGVSDLAWSPNNINFGSCGTDRQIMIWSINEQGPIKVLDSMANGITFDPFGKFMATQSSEEKTLTIWRIQQNFQNITQECTHSAYYKNAMSMSLFRRLSWSADGQFISTTAGKVGGMHTAPLIERSSWKLAATLAGHHKTITCSRINPRLYKDTEEGGSLQCYSVVAIASIDSTLTVWKPGMDNPLTVMLDIFKLGISDLSWGFNGNILLASSTDGKVVILQYSGGCLGQPLTELEKQLIIERKYGTSILNEYRAHTRLQQSQHHHINHNAQANNGNAGTQQQAQKNMVVNGKKKIVPVVTRQYTEESQTINPFMNPFHHQMIRDESALMRPTAGTISLNQDPGIRQQSNFPSGSSLENLRPTSLQQTSALPSSVSDHQAFASPLAVVVPAKQNQVLSMVVEPQVPQKAPEIPAPQRQDQQQEEQKKEEPGAANAGGVIDNSAKKVKKSKQRRKDESGQQINSQLPVNAAVNASAGSQGTGPQIQSQISGGAQIQQLLAQQNNILTNPSRAVSSISQSTLQTVAKEQYQQLERMLSENPNSNNQVAVMNLEDYQALISIQGKEEMQLILPARDMFSDEIRIFITNMDAGQSSNVFMRKRCAEIRLYSGSENQEVSRQVLDGEFIVMTILCNSFYILYTSRGQLFIYGTRTIQLIKSGLIIEGICFIDANDEALAFAVLTIKGNISVFRLKNVGERASGAPSLDSCILDYQTSVLDFLKIRQASLQGENGGGGGGGNSLSLNSKVTVKFFKLLKDLSVLVFLSDHSVFEYDVKMKLWRQAQLNKATSHQLPDQLRLLSNQQNRADGSQHIIQQAKDLSQVINQLESQNLDILASDGLEQMAANQIEMYQRVNELQESLQLYERLQMKKEFLYSMRMYTLTLLQLGDMNRLKELLTDYKFFLSWEDERVLENNKNHFKLTQEGAFNNLMSLVASAQVGAGDNVAMEDVTLRSVNMNGSGGGFEHASKKAPGGGATVWKEKPTLICGGLEKKQVFSSAIMPVIQTMCSQSKFYDIREYVSSLVQLMFLEDQASMQQQQQHVTLPTMTYATQKQQTASIQQHAQMVSSHRSEMQVSQTFVHPHLPSFNEVVAAQLQAPQYNAINQTGQMAELPSMQLPSISNIFPETFMKNFTQHVVGGSQGQQQQQYHQ